MLRIACLALVAVSMAEAINPIPSYVEDARQRGAQTIDQIQQANPTQATPVQRTHNRIRDSNMTHRAQKSLLSRSATPMMPGACLATVDMVHLLDAGEGLDERSQFNPMKRMGQLLIDGFYIGTEPQDSRVSAIIYGSEAVSQIVYTDEGAKSNSDAKNTIWKSPFVGGTSKPAAGINSVVKLINKDNRDGVPNVVIWQLATNHTPLAKATAQIDALSNLTNILPILIIYNENIYNSDDNIQQILNFTGCDSLEFCPNVFNAKITASSILSTQLAVKNYICSAIDILSEAPIAEPTPTTP